MQIRKKSFPGNRVTPFQVVLSKIVPMSTNLDNARF